MRFSNTLLLLILCFLVITWTVRSVPPQPPVQCDQTGCTVSNTYGVWPNRTNCKAAKVAYPTTEEELIKAVAYASEHNLKVKTVTRFSGTIPKLACPSGSDAMLISTSKYNSAIEIEPDQLTVTADSGVSLRELIDKVEEAGFSLATSPYWEGMSIGGLVSTGSHGSSWSGRGGSVHDHVVGINLVVPATSSKGYAKVVSIEEGRDVKLSIEKAFKRSITYNFTSDVALEDMFMEHGKKFEFGDITWYPSRKTAVYRYDLRSPDDVSGNGVNDFIEKVLETSKSENGKCKTADTTLAYKKLTGNGLKNNGLFFTGYPVIGTQGKLQSSGSCLFTHLHLELISLARGTRDITVFHSMKRLRYSPFQEDSVVIDFNYYREDDALTPRLNQDVMEEMEQMEFVKHGAKPHWGKNRNVGFFGAKQKYGPNFEKFLEVKNKLDPKMMFSSEWSDEILFGRESSKYDGCALEGNCVCSEDRHCSPSKGYFWRQGLVYTQARVCRFSSAQV
ncbi:hypothetical protein DY000_02019232 [Brassica cretica]|uniref:L-gulonolactone oxidase n=1 Tax=Brassica cretica TaxID=69181 RepID=A0ABQ7DBJ2_BRACR|nr:hypothetical protein DY000_02019232 [Brassica cretica]